MINIRRKVFETNSSSTHSICMCSKDEYDLFVKGKLFANNSWIFDSRSEFADKNLVTKEEIIDIYNKSEVHCHEVEELVEFNDEQFANYIDDEGFYTYDNYFSDYLEDFFAEYTTPSGETVVAFGEYGFDG